MARRDWKKQLFRVKQIADQNLGRVEKTEALTSDLQVLEKRVEQYGKTFSTTGKKLLLCLQGQPGHDVEKRQKKMPEYALANNLMEGSSLLGIETLVGQIFQICGDAEAQVANKTLQHELNIESRVLAPIHHLIDNDIPAIQKHKKNLQKVVLDMDSAKTRYTSAMKEQSKGGNNPGSGKVDGLRDEYEEACYRVDQCRDQLATEMFRLASREAELSEILLELIKCQASYHKQVLETLERRIPQIEEQIEFYTHMPVYGKPMDDHLRRTTRTIALVLEECVKNLLLLGGLEEEGLFRIAGAANKVKKLKAAFDSEQCADIAEEYDVHCIAGALKLYFRELPDPLMTSALYPEWMQAAHMSADQRLPALAEVVSKLPKLNYENLRYLIKFLSKLSEFQEVNKMSTSNIAIVMGPNLIWPAGENGPSVLTTSTQSAIVEALISHCHYFFPEDVDFQQYSKDQEPETPKSAMLRREKVDKAASDNGSKRHGVNAGLSLAHNSFFMPTSMPAAPKFNHNGSHSNDTDKVTIRVDGGGTDDKEDVIISSASTVTYRDRPPCSPGSRSGSNTDADSNDDDILEQIIDDANVPSQAPQPDLLNSTPQGAGSTYHSLPSPQMGNTLQGPDIMPQVHQLHAQSPPASEQGLSTPSQSAQILIGSLQSSPISPVGSQENMSASTGSLNMLEGYVGSKNLNASPKPPKRFNKKPAPLPPAERPHVPAPLPPVFFPPGEKPSSVSPNTTSPAAGLPYPVKPPLPDRPVSASSPVEQPQVAARPERPPSPTRRPVVPPPDRPLDRPTSADRPDKPAKPSAPPGEKLYSSSSPTTLGSVPMPKKSSPSVSTSGDHSPPLAAKIVLNAVHDTVEKPPVPPPPVVKPDTAAHTTPQEDAHPGHIRQGSSGRPPRPQPPPPPPPNKPPSVSQEDDNTTTLLPETLQSPNPEQTYL